MPTEIHLRPSRREVNMPDTRRTFVQRLAGVTGSLLFLQASPPIPHPRKRTEVDPPAAEDKEERRGEQGPMSLQKVRLQQQEKELRKTIEQLYSRVAELKTQVEGLHSSDIFSVAVFKQAQEIEKLAKQLKSNARP